MAIWRFPSNDHGESKGINDSGVSLFRGTPLRSLAREICQNSLDAAREETVIVEFNAFEISRDDLPGQNDLKDSFIRCSDFWGSQKSVTTKNFFSNAVEKISNEHIHMLRISDFGTTGLTGSREEINTDWTNLTKSSGVSDKRGSSGGSFGIGKFAPYASSDFSTVFYSTYDMQGLKASQGVSRIVTFRRSDGHTTQGIGYFGEENNLPVFSELNLEPGFSRGEKQYGTDIYIAGYKYYNEEGGWEKSIIVSILDSFLGAIWKKRLVVKVGQIEISAKTLDDVIEMYREELIGYTAQYYEVLTSKSTKWHEEDFFGMGIIRLGLLLGGQEMHRKVAMIRQTGMKIKDQDRISGFIPFAGIMFIEGDKLNKELRLLEGPEHTDWQVERADNVLMATNLLKSINQYIREKVEELALNRGQEDYDVAGLGGLLPDMPEENDTGSKEEAVLDNTITIDKTIPVKKPSTSSDRSASGTEADIKSDEGYVKGNSILGIIHGDGKRESKRNQQPYGVDSSPTENGKASKNQEVEPHKLRIMCLDKSEGKYALLFIPNRSGSNGSIRVSLSAENGSYPAPLLKASSIGNDNLMFSGNEISGLKFVKNELIRIIFYINFYDYCSMEVSAYADKE